MSILVFTGHSLQVNTNRLEMQEMTINTLKDSVTNLKKQLDLLHQQYETAEQEIQTHERCIIQLMEHDNKNKESDTEVMNNESAGNDTD